MTCRIQISSRVPPDFVSEKTPSVLLRLPRATKYCDGSGKEEEEEYEDEDEDEDDERGRSAAGGAACCSGTSGWLVEMKRRRLSANVDAAEEYEHEQLAMGDAAADGVRRAAALSALVRLIVIDIFAVVGWEEKSPGRLQLPRCHPRREKEGSINALLNIL